MAELPKLPELPENFDSLTKRKKSDELKKVLDTFPNYIDKETFTNTFIYSYLSDLPYYKGDVDFKAIFLNLNGIIGSGFKNPEPENKIATIFLFKCIRNLNLDNPDNIETLLSQSIKVGQNVYNIELPNGELHNIHPHPDEHNKDIATLDVEKIIKFLFKLLKPTQIEHELYKILVSDLQIENDSSFLNELFKSINPNFKNVDRVINREFIQTQQAIQQEGLRENHRRAQEVKQEKQNHKCKGKGKGKGCGKLIPLKYDYCEKCSSASTASTASSVKETDKQIVKLLEKKENKIRDLTDKLTGILNRLEELNTNLNKIHNGVYLGPLMNDIEESLLSSIEKGRRALDNIIPENLGEILEQDFENYIKKRKQDRNDKGEPTTKEDIKKDKKNAESKLKKKLDRYIEKLREFTFNDSEFEQNREVINEFIELIKGYVQKITYIQGASNIASIMNLFSQIIPKNIEDVERFNGFIMNLEGIEYMSREEITKKLNDTKYKNLLIKTHPSTSRPYVNKALIQKNSTLCPVSQKKLNELLKTNATLTLEKREHSVLDTSIIDKIHNYLLNYPFYLLEKKLIVAKEELELVNVAASATNVTNTATTNATNTSIPVIDVNSNQPESSENEQNPNTAAASTEVLSDWEAWNSEEEEPEQSGGRRKSRTRSRSSSSSNKTRKNTSAIPTKSKQSKKGKGKGKRRSQRK